MFKIYFKLFNASEGERHFELLEEASMAFFRNLGPAVHKIEMYENTGTVEELSWRVILTARREHAEEAFKLKRIVNIF